MKIVFNKKGDVVFTGDPLPTFPDEEVIIAQLDDPEGYNPEYGYTHSLVNEVRVAKRGELLNIDYSERDAAWEKIKYSFDRKDNYPSTQEQLDMIYWDKKNGTKKWEEAIDKVKADNPKPKESK